MSAYKIDAFVREGMRLSFLCCDGYAHACSTLVDVAERGQAAFEQSRDGLEQHLRTATELARMDAGSGADPVRCAGCDIPNGCPEFCRCKPADAGSGAVPAGFEAKQNCYGLVGECKFHGNCMYSCEPALPATPLQPVESAREVLALAAAAQEVHRHGAVVGKQWLRLGTALTHYSLWRAKAAATAPLPVGAVQEPADAVSRAKKIMALIDDFHDKPTSHTRGAIRSALLAEFVAPPAAPALASQEQAIPWRPMDTAPGPAIESEPFLVMRPANDVAAFVITQVSWFEGSMYPDGMNGNIDFNDRVTDATGWMPITGLQALPVQAPTRGALADEEPLTARMVSHAAFELCEFIEDIVDKPTDGPAVERFKAGQRYAAKYIRRGLGTWLTDEENRRKPDQRAAEAQAGEPQP